MLSVARVAAVDTRPGDLRLSHTVDPRPAVATLRLPGGVELRVLAASHQVVVTDPDGTRWVETVACGVDEGAGERVRDGLTVVAARAATAVEVRRLDGPAFAAEVDTWRRWGRESETALVVEFPGRDAVTGLARVPVGWASLHSYPAGPGGGSGDRDGGTVVLTRTAILSAGPSTAVSTSSDVDTDTDGGDGDATGAGGRPVGAPA